MSDQHGWQRDDTDVMPPLEIDTDPGQVKARFLLEPNSAATAAFWARENRRRRRRAWAKIFLLLVADALAIWIVITVAPR